MKITYNKNPLCTTVELDEHERELFRLKIKVKEMEDDMFNAHFYLTEGQYYDLDQARKELDPEYFLSNDPGEKKSGLDERVEMLLEHFLEELKSSHRGDCTCVPCSCSKCHAESILGIDTIPGVDKHSLYKIDGAFGKNNEKTINEALDSLCDYMPIKGEAWAKFSQEDFDWHIPRWKAEAAKAYEWLLNYRNTHFEGYCIL